MHRTARRRAVHHRDLPPDPDPGDVRTGAGTIARLLAPLLAGVPDALTAERVASDVAAPWSAHERVRVVEALEDEPDEAVAALHVLAATLRDADAARAAAVREAEGEVPPAWVRDLCAAAPTGACGITGSGDRLAFVSFEAAQPHVLAVGVFGGRRSRLGLLRPDLHEAWADARPLELDAAAALLRDALAPSMTLCGDGLPDLRHLGQRRLEVLEGG